MKMIFEDKKYEEYVYFDDYGDLIFESCTTSEFGESSNILDEKQQLVLYKELKEKFERHLEG